MSCDTTFPLLREYTFGRGEVFVGETFNMRSDEGVSFWDGFVVDAQMRAAAGGDLTYEFSTGAAVTDDDGVGVLSFSIPVTASASEVITPGKYVADVFVESDSLKRRRVLSARFTITPTVTRL